MRDFIGGNISIDGRMIEYRLFTSNCYLEAKYNYSEEELEKFNEDNDELCTLLNQVMALKQSCYLLRRITYSCGSLSSDLYDLKCRLIMELSEKYNFDFDEEFVENYG